MEDVSTAFNCTPAGLEEHIAHYVGACLEACNRAWNLEEVEMFNEKKYSNLARVWVYYYINDYINEFIYIYYNIWQIYISLHTKFYLYKRANNL